MSADQAPAADPTPGSSRVDVAGLRARAQKFGIVRVLAQAYGFCTCSRAQTRRGGHGTGCPWVDGERLDRLARALDAATIPPAPVLALLDERDDLAARLATAEAEIERLRDLALGDEQCCGDVCNGGACEGCLGCQAGWCVNGHDFPEGEWERMSAEDREQWWDVAREHNVGIDAALNRAEVAERQVQAVRVLADSLVWVRPEKSPCNNTDACCGSADSCDAMQPSVKLVGREQILAALAPLDPDAPTGRDGHGDPDTHQVDTDTDATPEATTQPDESREVCGDYLGQGWDQEPPCHCLLPKGHAGPCRCSHAAPAVPGPSDDATPAADTGEAGER